VPAPAVVADGHTIAQGGLLAGDVCRTSALDLAMTVVVRTGRIGLPTRISRPLRPLGGFLLHFIREDQKPDRDHRGGL
jgi:hypothetical protein